MFFAQIHFAQDVIGQQDQTQCGQDRCQVDACHVWRAFADSLRRGSTYRPSSLLDRVDHVPDVVHDDQAGIRQSPVRGPGPVCPRDRGRWSGQVRPAYLCRGCAIRQWKLAGGDRRRSALHQFVQLRIDLLRASSFTGRGISDRRCREILAARFPRPSKAIRLSRVEAGWCACRPGVAAR